MNSLKERSTEGLFSHDPPEIETIRKRLVELAGEERSLNNFTCQALQLVGEHIGARSLIVSIRDSEQDCGVIHARQIYRHNGWQFELGDTGAFNQPPAVQHRQAHDFSRHPLLNFRLDLPPKWLGRFQVEYPGTDRYSSEHHRTLGSIVTDLSYGLHIALLNQRQRNLEGHLQKEKRKKRNLRELSINQGKKIRALKRQMQLESHEIREMEKREGPVLEHFSRPMSSSSETPSVFAKQILEEIELSRKKALLGELASGVAHQIRNPLNNLLGALYLIKDNDISEEERRELFDRLTERVETFNRMISEFIRYTRSPQLNLNPEAINVALKNTLQSFKGWIDLAKVELKTSFDPQDPVIKLDLCLMDQVFHNIIKNALEAMYSNGRLYISTQLLKIKHGPKPRPEFIEISFQDSGPGIPQEDINKVLNPFYSRKDDGLGLGLSVVDHVVRAHGGGVRIKSRPGRFTNVILYLPIR